MRVEKAILATVVISTVMTTTAFAGTWKAGAAPNQNKWWYDFDNGTYAANGWYWIDGDNNGIAECYYFDANGWLLTDTTTPDGHMVNANGAWIENSIIQVRETGENITASQDTAQMQTSESAIDLSWLRNEDGTINWDLSAADGEDWCENNGVDYSLDSSFDVSAYYVRSVNSWAQNSARGAARKQLIDRYHIPCYLGNYITEESSEIGKFDYTVTLPAGITESEVDGVVATVEFILNIGARYDGCMETMSWKWMTGEDGLLTIHITADIALQKSRW